jgi:Protein required for attachment to host cells
MRKQWILVANGSLARFFSRNGVGDPLLPLETIDCPEARARGKALEHDHPFAHELAQRLEEGVVDGEYETFWLIASSPLLSEIQVCLKRGVDYRLQWTHDADFTGLEAGTLEKRLLELRESREPGMPAH